MDRSATWADPYGGRRIRQSRTSGCAFDDIFPEVEGNPFVPLDDETVVVDLIRCVDRTLLIQFSHNIAVDHFEILHVCAEEGLCLAHNIGLTSRFVLEGITPKSQMYIRIRACFSPECVGLTKCFRVSECSSAIEALARNPEPTPIHIGKSQTIESLKNSLGYQDRALKGKREAEKNENKNENELDAIIAKASHPSKSEGFLSIVGSGDRLETAPDPRRAVSLVICRGASSIHSSPVPTSISDSLKKLDISSDYSLIPEEFREPVLPGYKPSNLRWKTGFVCHVCKLYCTSSRQYTDHLSGRRHFSRCETYLTKMKADKLTIPSDVRNMIYMMENTRKLYSEMYP